MLDAREVCPLADYFIICSGDSDRQIEAIREGIAEVMKRAGVSSHHSEGTTDSGWILLDFGSVIVHIFAPSERDYYQLDRLWERATPVIRIQ